MESYLNRSSNTWKSAQFFVVNLFIIAYSLGTFILCSAPSACRDVLVQAVKPFFNFLGLYQYFWMYAPNPPDIYTIRIYADITFKDHTHKSWEFPRLLDFKNNFYQYQSKHRYYQWKYYLFDPKGYPEILKDAALYAARMNFNPHNPPIAVLLYKETVKTVVPYYRDNGEVRTENWGQDTFYSLELQAEEL